MKKTTVLIGIFSIFMNIQAASGQSGPLLDYKQINQQLAAAEQKINTGRISPAEITDLVKEFADLQENVRRDRDAYAAMLDNVSKKIQALVNIPADGQKEPAEIAAKRKEFTLQNDLYKARIANADLTDAKIEEINKLIVKTRNQELLNDILAKQGSIFQFHEFGSSLLSFSKFLYTIARSPETWYQQLSARDKQIVDKNIIAIFIIMLLSLGTAVLLSRYIRKNLGYRQNIEKPDYSLKVRAGLWMLTARGVIPAAILGAFLLWVHHTPLVNTGPFGLLLSSAAEYLLYYFIAKALIRAVFTPDNPEWRIIETDDRKARRGGRALLLSAALICLTMFFQNMAARLEYDAQTIYSLKLLANGIKAFCIALVALKFLYDAPDISDDDLKDDNIAGLTVSSQISLLISVIAALSFGVSLFGYIRLSEFILNRLIASSVIIMFFYIISKLLRAVFHRFLLLRFWVRTLRINRRRLVKTEFWFGVLLTPFLMIFCLLLLLALWGVSVDILILNIKRFLTGFNIGGMHISITSILLGIFSFFISLFLFKMLRGSLMSGNLSKLDIEEGMRSSLAAGISFFGFILSVLIAVAVMGGSFGSIAIVAGALSFGVGLGLQTIVNNFVSGLIILFERPLKIGDWVIVSGQEGIVKQINMRATELETWNKANIIIPNSEILSGSLINLTYSNRMGRIDVKIGVAYNSDVDLVKQTLLAIAKDTPDVLTEPAPFVAFNDFADNSLNFQLSCFTANIYNRLGISNSIKENILKKFRKLNIEIPFPQRVIYLDRQF